MDTSLNSCDRQSSVVDGTDELNFSRRPHPNWWGSIDKRINQVPLTCKPHYWWRKRSHSIQANKCRGWLQGQLYIDTIRNTCCRSNRLLYFWELPLLTLASETLWQTPHRWLLWESYLTISIVTKTRAWLHLDAFHFDWWICTSSVWRCLWGWYFHTQIRKPSFYQLL